MDNLGFLELAETWHEQLKSCQFAGEISLSPAKLAIVAGGLNILGNDKQRELYECAVLIVAVNCAYYLYDDQGFWKHFIELSGIEDTESIGMLIERALRRYALLSVERSGPFRYVGAILEQCGISLRYVGAFAQVVKALKIRYGWGRISKITYSRFIDVIKDLATSRYLRDFLLDQVGYGLTIETCRLMSMYEEGLLSRADLHEAIGYRPGFWDEFLQAFGYKRDRAEASEFHADPVIFLDVITRTIGMKFASPDYVETVFNQGEFTFPVTNLVLPDDFYSEYSGTVGRRRWIIGGWVPGDRPILFERSATARMVNSDNVPPGEYYLVARKSYPVPKEMLLKELGPANLQLAEPYVVFVVKASVGDVLPGVAIREGIQKGSHIAVGWKSEETLYFKYSSELFDVFEGNIPDLDFDFSLTGATSAVLFYEVGRNKGRIKNKSDIEELRKAIASSLPVKGSIWLDTIDRKRHNWPRPVLRFGVVPAILPDLTGAVDNDKDMDVHVQAYKGGTTVLLDCKQTGTGTWKVPVKLKELRGEFISKGDNVRLKFCIPLARLALIDKSGSEVRVFGEADLHQRQPFRISGLSGASAHGVLGSGSLELAVNSHGEFQFPVESLLGLTKTGLDPFYISQGDRNIHTGSFFIHQSSLIENICNVGAKAFCVDASSDIYRALDLLSNIVHRPRPRITMNSLPRFHKVLDRIIDLFLACTAYFDQTEIIISGKKYCWSEADLGIINRYMNGEAGQLEYESAVALSQEIPPVTRWLRLLSDIKPATPFTDLIVEWSMDVKSARHVGIKSELGNRAGGGLLTRAWIYYRTGDYTNAILCLQKSNGDNSVLVALNKLLQVVVYVRQARFQEAHRVLSNIECEEEFASVFDVLVYLSKVLTGCHGTNRDAWSNTDDVSLILDFLGNIPFAERDLSLLSHFVTSQVANCQSLRSSDDWLMSWLEFKYSKNCDLRTLVVAAEHMSVLADRIPVSPSRTAMIKELNEVIRRKHYETD